MDMNSISKLREQVVFSFWEKKDDTHTVVRFATSWATKMEDVKKLAELLSRGRNILSGIGKNSPDDKALCNK